MNEKLILIDFSNKTININFLTHNAQLYRRFKNVTEAEKTKITFFKVLKNTNGGMTSIFVITTKLVSF